MLFEYLGCVKMTLQDIISASAEAVSTIKCVFLCLAETFDKLGEEQ